MVDHDKISNNGFFFTYFFGKVIKIKKSNKVTFNPILNHLENAENNNFIFFFYKSVDPEPKEFSFCYNIIN